MLKRGLLIPLFSFPFFIGASEKENFLVNLFDRRPDDAMETIMRWDRSGGITQQHIPYLLYLTYQLKKDPMIFGDDSFVQVMRVMPQYHTCYPLIKTMRIDFEEMRKLYWEMEKDL